MKTRSFEMQHGLWPGNTRSPNVSEEEALVALSLVPGLGPGKIRALLARFRTARNVFAASEAAFAAVPGIGPGITRAVRQFEDWDAVAQQMERSRRVDAKLLTAGSADFPPLLSEIYDPPAYLWIRGDVAALSTPAVAVVGTRRATDYGKRAAFELSSELARRGITIVSGLAYGIDREAHRGAINGGGRTIAVLGSGVDVIYPSRHEPLAEEIIACGAVISEEPLGGKPDAPNFPQRNRIVSGLCLGTVVVEAYESGGALITARLALEQNREVWAVPSPIYNPSGTGTNRLIRDGCGKLILSVDDVLSDLRIDTGRESEVHPAVELTPIEERIFDVLETDPVHIDSICLKTDLDPSTALVYLLNLEFKGLVRQMAGKQFFRA